MRSLIIIAVLSALAACYVNAVHPTEEDMSEVYTIVFDDNSLDGRVLSRAEFNARYEGWVLLSEANDFAPAVEGREQSVEMFYRAQRGVQISMVSITAYVSIPEINRSPLGKNYIEVTLKSRIGAGLNTTIELFRRQ
uniref:Repat1 n=1 Tax=Spodoptera exigua TaxID=7107 RepID=A8QVZ2_SPOEX|nr:Repat1 [Spodoptera exigua]